jgi:murein tripeptide amidase MpaA
MPYFNVEEVESALEVATSAPYTAFAKLIELPKKTWENRTCHAIKIANGSGPYRPGIYFLGGVHAREWGTSDILINFIEQLEQAYLKNTGLTFGNTSFSASDIQSIVNTLDIFVFPQANPDGREFSMTSCANWRKNRRILAPNSDSGSCVGVDINRNYDFLWGFPTYFHPDVVKDEEEVEWGTIMSSTDPCEFEVYIGPSAFSEPETENAKWIFDNFPNIGFFIDVHTYSDLILYNWGDDQNQTTDPPMNFQNSTYNKQRGLPDDSAYSEYISPSDLSSAISLANSLHDGIQGVRGTKYTVQQSFSLYPTSGTSDDYAYSRHIVDGSKNKIFAYTLECGNRNNEDPFHPMYSEMQNIIQEAIAGLLAFCLAVRVFTSPVSQLPNLGKWEAVFTLLLGGVIYGGAGIGITPGLKPKPIDPNPPLLRLPKDKQDILIGLAITEIASIINDPESRVATESAGLEVMTKAIEELKKLLSRSPK